ncbi:ABC transporter permease [Frigoriflavimonas asaccharolytica]|uniref:ABC-2 type transport system permease protein n=1 Tax=Frigoriflavimonas asaccharolytica TaxID=2735899 RepID=A0A8J8K8G1_9FLAO|nr:ABC transporter permease [Frigoriflavimonas asaccharolytica]NRS91907.1 ABC-2 type transport system permease protein [Frigoriflavimonas asaccharolytica]
MLAIFKKEIWSYFGNWSAWIIIAIFSILGGLFLFFFDNNSNIFEIGTASLQSYFQLAPWLLLFLIPALSMRSFAEEQQSGTLSWLFSLPLKFSDLIVGKFLAVWFLGILCIIPSLVYLYSIYVLGIPAGNLDFGATLGSYFGLILLIAAFSAIGIFSSTISNNQIMAYLIGVFICFIMYFGIEQLASYKLLGGADYFLQNLGISYHYNSFSRGLIDSKDIFYFLIVISLALFLAKLSLEKKK